MNKYLYLAIKEDCRVIDRVVPCEYASEDAEEVMNKVTADERDLIVSYVKIKNFKKYAFGKRIYAAFTEEQYKQFEECRRLVDFAGIVEGYHSIQ